MLAFGLRKCRWKLQTWKEEQPILCKALQGWGHLFLGEGAARAGSPL